MDKNGTKLNQKFKQKLDIIVEKNRTRKIRFVEARRAKKCVPKENILTIVVRREFLLAAVFAKAAAAAAAAEIDSEREQSFKVEQKMATVLRSKPD